MIVPFTYAIQIRFKYVHIKKIKRKICTLHQCYIMPVPKICDVYFINQFFLNFTRNLK